MGSSRCTPCLSLFTIGGPPFISHAMRARPWFHRGAGLRRYEGRRLAPAGKDSDACYPFEDLADHSTLLSRSFSSAAAWFISRIPITTACEPSHFTLSRRTNGAHC